MVSTILGVTCAVIASLAFLLAGVSLYIIINWHDDPAVFQRYIAISGMFTWIAWNMLT